MTVNIQHDEHKYHYWLVAHGSDGKPYLVYGAQHEDEAREKGLELFGNIDFDIKRFPTRNLQRASSLFKGRRLEETHSLDKASQRIGHGKSFRRLRERQSRQIPKNPGKLMGDW